MKERTGQLIESVETGKWIARVCYFQSNGKRTAIQKSAEKKSDARKLLKQLLEKVEKGGREAIEAEKVTFNDLLNYYEQHHAKPAKFIDSQKVEGMRNFERVRGFVRVFREYFGNRKISKISYGDILVFKQHRLAIPTHYKKRVRNVATMNRELSCLRRVFNIAIRQGWISRNPMSCGESLIDISAERRRERILNPRRREKTSKRLYGT